MKVKILRQQSPFSPPYRQTFQFEPSPEDTVASMLDKLNYHDDIVDENGNPADRISWECSCLQGMCGGCAMVINGRPALACETFLRDMEGDVELRPLSKFPVVCDLVVDRTSIQDNLRSAQVYVHGYTPSSGREYDHQYAAAKCLKCGLCLEVCPNYVKGERFYGAAFANECYLTASQSGDRKELLSEYGKHFAAGCSKSLSCRDVCPMKIPTLASIAKLNRMPRRHSGAKKKQNEK